MQEIIDSIEEALEQAQLAYEFSPNAYTSSALRALTTARDSLKVYVELMGLEDMDLVTCERLTQ
jgi:hypothetical protein